MNQDFKKCKFVILDTIDGEMPVLIPDAMSHKYFKAFVPNSVKMLAEIISDEMYWKDNARAMLSTAIRPISAGFFDLDTLKTYGESTGLKMKPRPEDADLIKTFFNLEEI